MIQYWLVKNYYLSADIINDINNYVFGKSC